MGQRKTQSGAPSCEEVYWIYSIQVPTYVGTEYDYCVRSSHGGHEDDIMELVIALFPDR